jgi:hypothetical protein
MIFFWRSLLFLSLSGFLFACAPPQQTVEPAEPSPAVTTPTVRVTDLPCAEINNAETVTITYPSESLYKSGAALPKMEGLACLEVLADWLQTVPDRAWKINVGGEDGHGFDPQKLAEKRQELLQRFFQRKGIDTSEWQWQKVPAREIQLQFTGLT